MKGWKMDNLKQMNAVSHITDGFKKKSKIHKRFIYSSTFRKKNQRNWTCLLRVIRNDAKNTLVLSLMNAPHFAGIPPQLNQLETFFYTFFQWNKYFSGSPGISVTLRSLDIYGVKSVLFFSSIFGLLPYT